MVFPASSEIEAACCNLTLFGLCLKGLLVSRRCQAYLMVTVKRGRDPYHTYTIYSHVHHTLNSLCPHLVSFSIAIKGNVQTHVTFILFFSLVLLLSVSGYSFYEVC